LSSLLARFVEEDDTDVDFFNGTFGCLITDLDVFDAVGLDVCDLTALLGGAV
jgi:hypothetical protein